MILGSFELIIEECFMEINWNTERDWKVLAPIFAILIAGLAVILPNTENYLPFVFVMCTGLIGIYGGIKGNGVKKADVDPKDTSNQNTLNLPAGLIRLVLGVFCLLTGLVLAAFKVPDIKTILFFGLAGELLGISIPAIYNYFN